MPGGEGYADIVYLPQKDSNYPILVVELKWNTGVRGAIEQIKDRQYPMALEGYGARMLLVGISYDKEAEGGKRKHHCVIEKFEGK